MQYLILKFININDGFMFMVQKQPKNVFEVTNYL